MAENFADIPPEKLIQYICDSFEIDYIETLKKIREQQQKNCPEYALDYILEKEIDLKKGD